MTTSWGVAARQFNQACSPASSIRGAGQACRRGRFGTTESADRTCSRPCVGDDGRRAHQNFFWLWLT